ncbi:dephospho-CoA kinase [Candidatus Pelagibacter sp.]|nr:dephospho-CoA kinase [Candidatus Pelagibacter sp.]
MIRLGIIGSIGSGKTFIGKLFKAPIFNADKEVNDLYRYNRECFNKLKKKLPKFVNSFPIKKNDLSKAIIEDKKNLKKISSIVHPLVRKRMKKFLNKNKNSKILVLDVPLLVENKLYNKNDILIFVKSNKKKILKRLKERPNYNKDVLKKLVENQVILSKKKRLANYIVDNNFSPKIMKKKIKTLKKKILNERNNS